MRNLFTTFFVVLAFAAITPTNSFAETITSASKPQVHLTAWKNEINSENSDHNTDLPSLLSPVDSPSQVERAAVDSQQNIPVEAVPAPTAVASGMLVLAGLAAVRIVRKIRFA